MYVARCSVKPKRARSPKCGCIGTEQRCDRAPVNSRMALGMQGWDHPNWIGDWYAPSLDSAARLGEYAKRFSSVEVDDTFYGIPPEPVVRHWRDSVPADFSFALKTPQQVTHERRFSDHRSLLKRFLDRASLLEDKLGPILLIAPPSFDHVELNRASLRSFVEQLPAGFRWALELKHAGWFTTELHDLLASKNVALVLGESRWIRRSSLLDQTKSPTADFAYLRWNNKPTSQESVTNPEGRGQVSANWSKTLEELSTVVNAVYGYFNINAFGNGLLSLEELRRALGQQWLEVSVARDAS